MGGSVVSWALNTYVQAATVYYVVCLIFGALAFILPHVVGGSSSGLRALNELALHFVGRGRTYDESRGDALQIPGLGKPLNNSLRRALRASVPKSWFSHLYHVAVSWNLLWLVILASHVYCLPDATSVSKLLTQLEYRNTMVALGCVQFHVTRRLWENYFVHKHSQGARMQMLAYVLALFYYIFLPANFFTPKLVESLSRDFFLTGDTDTCVLEQFEFFATKVLHSFQHKQQILLIAIFLFGNVMQYQCHRALALLRPSSNDKMMMQNKKKSKKKAKVKDDDEVTTTTTSKYRVPRGLWFSYSSNPHYLAEVILYTAFISLSNMWHTKTLLLMGMVVMNLLQSALLTHNWYKKEFKDYPKSRYAMFPLLV